MFLFKKLVTLISFIPLMLFKKAQEYFKSLVTKSINKSLFNLTIFTLLVTKQTPYKSNDCPSAFHLITTVPSIF